MAKSKKQKTEETAVKEKGLELFDFLKLIQEDQKIESFDSLSEADTKKYAYSRYMIHRFLSMNTVYLPLVNEIQKYSNIPNRAHYQFFTNVLPRGRSFNKYIKGAADTKYENWLVELLTKHYHISKSEAITYLDIYYRDDKDGLRTLCENYGIDKKTLKSAKL